MSPRDLSDLLRKRPFVPFRISSTEGRTHDLRHPDQALVSRTRGLLLLPSGSGEVAERSEHLAGIHVIRAAVRSPDSSSPTASVG
jgi:hypothetical protein